MSPTPRSFPARPVSASTSGGGQVIHLRVVDTDAYADWESVYRDNVGRLYRLMYSRVGNRTRCRRPDVRSVPDRARARCGMGSSKGEVRAYLLATARTVLASHWRRRLGLPVTSIDPDSDLRTRPSRRALTARRGPIAGEADTGRPAGSVSSDLELRFLEACSIKEAAQAMDVSVSNAKVLQHRALRMAAEDRTGAGTMTNRRLAAYVDALADGKRPDAFDADPEDTDVFHTAISLRSARPGDAIPDPQFVVRLHKELAREAEPQVVPIDRPTRGRRRRSAMAAIAASLVLVGGTGGGNRDRRPRRRDAGSRAGASRSGSAHRNLRDCRRSRSWVRSSPFPGKPLVGLHER